MTYFTIILNKNIFTDQVRNTREDNAFIFLSACT